MAGDDLEPSDVADVEKVQERFLAVGRFRERAVADFEESLHRPRGMLRHQASPQILHNLNRRVTVERAHPKRDPKGNEDNTRDTQPDKPVHMSEVNYAEAKCMIWRKDGADAWAEAAKVLIALPIEFHPVDRELADVAADFKSRFGQSVIIAVEGRHLLPADVPPRSHAEWPQIECRL